MRNWWFSQSPHQRLIIFSCVFFLTPIVQIIAYGLVKKLAKGSIIIVSSLLASIATFYYVAMAPLFAVILVPAIATVVNLPFIIKWSNEQVSNGLPLEFDRNAKIAITITIAGIALVLGFFESLK